jgi:arylsulfatase
MDRRRFITLVSSSLAAGTTASAIALQSSSEAPLSGEKLISSARKTRPNVILMICDDLGYGDLGCHGSKLPTPNIDSIAAEGIHFTRFNAAHPICSASRAALLTGRYGQRSNTTGAFHPRSATGTSLDETLLSNLFRAHGYKTKAVGKWHLGDAPEYLPTNRGFDSFYGVPYSVDMKPLPLLRDTTTLEPDTALDLLTPRYTEEAVKYIDQSDDKPFFLYLAFSYPHDPVRASARFSGKTGSGDYGDAVAEIDWSVGEILRAVDRKGISSDTLICFTSDHGPWFQGNPGLLRGRKTSTFEGGFRVPLLAKWKGTISPGQVTDTWCSNLDILPTLSSLCDLQLPQKPLDGKDMSEVLLGQKKPTEDASRLYFSPTSNHGVDVHCIRKGAWKLRVAQGRQGGGIYVNDSKRGTGSAWLAHPELYNLALDPTEGYDVARFHPEIVTKLSVELETLMQSFPSSVQKAYQELRQNKSDMRTPPGGSPRSSRDKDDESVHA